MSGRFSCDTCAPALTEHLRRHRNQRQRTPLRWCKGRNSTVLFPSGGARGRSFTIFSEEGQYVVFLLLFILPRKYVFFFLFIKTRPGVWISVSMDGYRWKVVYQAPLTLWVIAVSSFFVSQTSLCPLKHFRRSFLIFRDCHDLSVFVRRQILPYFFFLSECFDLPPPWHLLGCQYHFLVGEVCCSAKYL